MKTDELLRKQYDPKPRIQPIFMDLPTVAAALSVSVSTVQALVRAGDLPGPRKISGNRVGWLWREIVEWSENRPVSDIPPPPNTGAKKPRKPAPQDGLITA
jgi:prophage regulatory protein